MKTKNYLFLLNILIPVILVSCCGKPPAPSPGVALKFVGVKNNTIVYIIETLRSDINSYIDTSYNILNQTNHYTTFLDFKYKTEDNGNYIIFLDTSYTYPDNGNYFIFLDTSGTKHTITDVELYWKSSRCGDELDGYNYKFDGVKKTNKDASITIQY